MERTGLCAECAELLVPYIDGELPPDPAAFARRLNLLVLKGVQAG